MSKPFLAMDHKPCCDWGWMPWRARQTPVCPLGTGLGKDPTSPGAMGDLELQHREVWHLILLRGLMWLRKLGCKCLQGQQAGRRVGRDCGRWRTYVCLMGRMATQL